MTSTSWLEAYWKYVGSSGATFPNTRLTWNIKNKGATPAHANPRFAYGLGSTGGIIAREFKNTGSTTLATGYINLTASFKEDDGSGGSTKAGWMRGYFGDNWIEARWVDTHGSSGAWLVSRRIRKSNGAWEAGGVVIEWKNNPVSFGKPVFYNVAQNAKLLNRVTVGDTFNPHTDTSWRNKNNLYSGIANGGASGTADSVEDTWKGMMQVQSFIVIDES
jgi:hypothetical protein